VSRRCSFRVSRARSRTAHPGRPGGLCDDRRSLQDGLPMVKTAFFATQLSPIAAWAQDNDASIMFAPAQNEGVCPYV
jgi:hypothetical protein